MEFEQKREFMKTCEVLSCFADKLKEDLAKYRLEVMIGVKMLPKQRELLIISAFRTVVNIISRCDMLIKSVGHERFEKLECYDQLAGFIAVCSKPFTKNTVLSQDQSVQTNMPKSGTTVCENTTTENEKEEYCEVTVTVKEEMCGYDSDETVLIETDTNLKDVLGDVGVPRLEENREDSYLRVPTPTKSYSSSSTEDGSYIFNLKSDDQEHSKNNVETGRGAIPFAPPSCGVAITTNEKEPVGLSSTEATPPGTTGGNCEDVSMKNESIFEKSTQLVEFDTETENLQDVREDIVDNVSEETVVMTQKSPQSKDENSSRPHLQLRVEHESDFEEDDDYYQLKNDSDLESSSSLSDSEPEDIFGYDSNKSDVFSEKDDSDSSHESLESKLEDTKLQRKCVVNLKRLPQKIMNRLLSSQTGNVTDSECDNGETNEDPLTRLKKEIERLTDLSTLKCRKKRNKKYKPSRNSKKRKMENGKAAEEQSEEESTSTSESSTESDISVTRDSTVGSPFQKPLALEDLQYEILKNMSDVSESESDDSEIYSESSSKSDAESISRQERREGQKENSNDNKGCNTTVKKKVAEWRKDSLLCGKLVTESSSSDSDVPKASFVRRKRRIISSESEVQSERLPVEDIVKQENGIKEESKEDAEDAKTTFTNSTPLYEVTDILSGSSESSDVEFVCPSIHKKNDLYINSEDKNVSDDDVEFVEEDAGKPGRKNIRKVLDDVNLGEETKKANKEEEAHRHRLMKKKKELESWSQTSESSQVEGLVLDLNKTTKQAVITVDPILTARLKQHQIEGVRFMWDICYESVERLKESPGTGCILAHCMGLGKTYQVIVLIHTLFKYPETNTSHVLIVCPLSTVLNWVNEFEWGLKNVDEKVNVFYLRKQNAEKVKVLNRWRKKKGVLIMGYEAYERLVRSDTKEIIEALVDPGPDLIVCDEGHLIKNEKAIRSQALNRVKTRRRIMLTGTPIQNNLKEYYYMVNFVKPKLLGTYKEYCNRFVNPITNGQYHDSTQYDIKIMKKRSHVLHKLLRSTVQRYEVSELEKQIPKKLDYVIFIKSHPLQADLYKQYIKNIRIGEVTRILGHYSRLQGILSHPLVLDLKEKNDALSKKNERKEVEVIDLEPEIKENEPLPSGWWRNFCPEDYKDNLDYGPKFKVMLKIIDECENIGDKLLIFSNSMPEMDAIEYNLKKRTIENRNWKRGVEYYRMDGTVPPEERNNICDSFNNPNNTKAKVFLISYKVGGLGLNMVAANRVILMDVNWNPSYETQSIFRIYRFGQVKDCFVYRLVSMGTIEEVIYQRSVTKLSIAGRVVDERQITRHYKCAELQEMLRFNLNLEEARPTPKPPTDKLLAKLLLELQTEIFKYHEHQALLENRPDEELNEEEMKLAWDEYHQEQIREKEIKRIEPIPVTSVTNAFLDPNRRMDAFALANSSNTSYSIHHRRIESALQDPPNMRGDNNVRMESAAPVAQNSIRQIQRPILFLKHAESLLKKPKRTLLLTKSPNFREMLLNNSFAKHYMKTLPRNQSKTPVLKPFLPSSNDILPTTSSSNTIQLQPPKRHPRNVVVMNGGTNYISEVNQLRGNALVEQNVDVEQDQDHTDMVQTLRKEYTRFLKIPEASKTGSEKRTELMTPIIQNVFSEAHNNTATSNVIDRADVMKLISNNASLTLLPRADDKNQPNTDDVIEIL